MTQDKSRAKPEQPEQRKPQPPGRPAKEPNEVDEAGEESFPASDPPSWTPTHTGEPDPQGDEGKGERRKGRPG